MGTANLSDAVPLMVNASTSSTPCESPVMPGDLNLRLPTSGDLNLSLPSSTPSDASITVSSLILLVLVILIPVWLLLAYKNQATRNVLFYGWIPVICAMCISRSAKKKRGFYQVVGFSLVVGKYPVLGITSVSKI